MAERTAETVQSRLEVVRGRLAVAAPDPARVSIVAVTKGFGPEAVEAAVAAGLADIGENYADELEAKAAGAPEGVRWHFLGAPQRNKLGRLAPLVCLWHGLDSEPAALALGRRRPGASVLVQVNLAPGAGRRGVQPGDAEGLVRAASCAGLEVRGLMAVARPGADRPELAEGFRSVAVAAGRLGLAELSMGMSDDYEVAVAEGATIVRLGRALFGERPEMTRGGIPPR